MVLLLVVPMSVVTSIAVLGPAGPVQAATGSGSGTATSDGSPVNLATPVDMSDGMAHQSAIVRAGDARIEVLSPTLLRLEYSPTGNFENNPTVNVLDRQMPVPPYRAQVQAGWLTVRTSQAVLKYRVGSGPFTPQNTSLQLSVNGQVSTVQPTWEWECTFDQVCQAGAAELAGGASFGQGSSGYLSTAGYIGNLLATGSGATWNVLGAPAGSAVLTIRYSTYPVIFNPPAARNFDVMVNGTRVATLTAPLTASDNQWADLTTNIALKAGTNAVEIRCGAGEGCNTNIDTVSVAPEGAAVPSFAPSDPLGGWIRGFDTDTYNFAPTCSQGEEGATCQADIEPPIADGLLDQAGWRLARRHQHRGVDNQGWVQPRPQGGDRRRRLPLRLRRRLHGSTTTLAQLTGSTPLLPRNDFGVWYSDYTPVLERHHRTIALPGLQSQRRAAQHPFTRYRLESPQRLERMGVEHLALPRPEPIPALDPVPGHRRHLERPLEHRRRRPEGDRPPNTSPRRRCPRPVAWPASARCGTGAWSSRPSPTSSSSRASRTREWRSGGWTGAVTRRRCRCEGSHRTRGSAISTRKR